MITVTADTLREAPATRPLALLTYKRELIGLSVISTRVSSYASTNRVIPVVQPGSRAVVGFVTWETAGANKDRLCPVAYLMDGSTTYPEFREGFHALELRDGDGA